VADMADLDCIAMWQNHDPAVHRVCLFQPLSFSCADRLSHITTVGPCMYMYGCIYVCMCIYVSIYIYMYVYVCVYINMYVSISHVCAVCFI